MNRKISIQRRRYYQKDSVGTANVMLGITTVVIIFLCVYNSF
jgi:hypothetical protein